MMTDPQKDTIVLENPAVAAGFEERSDEGPAEETARLVVPDPETPEKPLRRRFSAAYKLGILEQVEACTAPGEMGRLLRREGLYSSHLVAWRKARQAGSLAALSKRRGRKPQPVNPLVKKVQKLERENERLQGELSKAHLILDVQGKVAGLLGLSFEDGKSS